MCHSGRDKSQDNTLRIWDVATGTELALVTLDAAVSALAATPDNRIVAGDAFGRIHVLGLAP